MQCVPVTAMCLELAESDTKRRSWQPLHAFCYQGEGNKNLTQQRIRSYLRIWSNQKVAFVLSKIY